MATVNFSVPDEIKQAFDKAFGNQNKSAVIAGLMQRAVDEQQLQKRRDRLFRELTSARSRRSPATSKAMHNARVAGRT